MSFNSDLNDFATHVERKADARVRRIALAALQIINEGSPVDKGTFRANWVAAIDTLDRSYDLSLTEEDVGKSLSKASAVITSGAKLGTTVYICNSVPYAILIEDGYGGSKHVQKPEGVVEPAITKIKNAIEAGRL